MSGYVLQRHEDGALVAPPGRPSSYTRDLRKARIFPSAEAAQQEACGNESPRPVESLLEMTR